MTFLLVAIPVLVSGAAPGLKLDGVKSNVEAWPVAKLQQEAAASLARASTQPEAGFTVVADPEARADVLVRGLLAPAKDGAVVRFTWALKTQGCPMLTDQVAWDFKTARLSPVALDSMTTQLGKRAQVLLDKAHAQHETSCIPIDGVAPRTVTASKPPSPPPPTQQPPSTFPIVGGLPQPPVRARFFIGRGGATATGTGGSVPASNY